MVLMLVGGGCDLETVLILVGGGCDLETVLERDCCCSAVDLASNPTNRTKSADISAPCSY